MVKDGACGEERFHIVLIILFDVFSHLNGYG